MDPRTLAVGFVGVLLGGMMTFVIATNDERMASSHDRGQAQVQTVAAAQESHGAEDHESHGAEDHESHGGEDHTDEHTLIGAASHSHAGTHADGHTDSTAHTGSAAGTHGDVHVGDEHPPGTHPHPPGPGPNPGDHQHPPLGGPPPGPGGGGAGGTPTGPIVSIDDPRLTPAQRGAAQALLDRTREGMAAFPTVAAVEAAGYTSIGDGRGSGYEHFVNWSYLQDGRELDPAHIESIVVRWNAGGTKQVVSAMYILELGAGMADVPDIAGSLTTWHDHRNLCWEGTRLAGTLVNGRCQPGGELRVTPPMLHVWIVPHPCGPFAGIEGHGAGCGHTH